ncbi:CocE/NonD family hydrolase [Nocardia sp. NPDC004711]
MLESGDDGPFWQNPLIRLEGRWSEYPSGVALFAVSGWYAHHAQANLDKFEQLGRDGSRPFHLIIGPWVHSPAMLDETVAGDVDFGFDAAKFGPWKETWPKWLAAYLLDDQPVEAVDLPPISYFVMGGGGGHKTEVGHLFHGGHWRASNCWPPSDGSSTDLYLSAPGVLGPNVPSADSARSSSFDFDPHDPCPGIGSVSLQEQNEPAFVRPGPWNQWHDAGFAASRGRTGPLNARDDVLTFETAPLESPLTIAGPVRAKLFVTTSGPDTDFVVRLIDVYPPSDSYPRGYDMLISDGIVRMRYRDDRVLEELAEPGEVYELDVELGPTANIFAVGHRLRIDVTSSSYPQYDVNPNTGRPMGDYTDIRVAHQTVFHDSTRPSRIIFWVLDT